MLLCPDILSIRDLSQNIRTIYREQRRRCQRKYHVRFWSSDKKVERYIVIFVIPRRDRCDKCDRCERCD